MAQQLSRRVASEARLVLGLMGAGLPFCGGCTKADYRLAWQPGRRSLWTLGAGGFHVRTALCSRSLRDVVPQQKRHESLEALMEILGEAAVEPVESDDVANEQRTISQICSEKCSLLPQCYLRLLDLVHSNFELPWWLSIVAVAVGARLIIFPFITVGNYRRVSKYHNAVPSLQALHHDINEARRRENLRDIIFREKQLDAYCEQNHVPNVGSQLLPIAVSATLFFTQFFAVMKAAKASCIGFDSEGVLWFSNLTANSPLLAVGASSMYCVWMLVRLRQTAMIGGTDSVSAMMGYSFIAASSVALLVYFATIPSAVLCFIVPEFAMNGAFASLYSLSLYRRLLRIEDPLRYGKNEYIDLPEQVTDGFTSRLGKMRAIRKVNLAHMREAGLPLIFDPERLPAKIKQFIFRRKPAAAHKTLRV